MYDQQDDRLRRRQRLQPLLSRDPGATGRAVSACGVPSRMRPADMPWPAPWKGSAGAVMPGGGFGRVVARAEAPPARSPTTARLGRSRGATFRGTRRALAPCPRCSAPTYPCTCTCPYTCTYPCRCRPSLQHRGSMHKRTCSRPRASPRCIRTRCNTPSPEPPFSSTRPSTQSLVRPAGLRGPYAAPALGSTGTPCRVAGPPTRRAQVGNPSCMHPAVPAPRCSPPALMACRTRPP